MDGVVANLAGGRDNLQIGKVSMDDLQHNHPHEVRDYSNTVIVDGQCLQCLLHSVQNEDLRKRIEQMVTKLSLLMRTEFTPINHYTRPL